MTFSPAVFNSLSIIGFKQFDVCADVVFSVHLLELLSASLGLCFDAFHYFWEMLPVVILSIYSISFSVSSLCGKLMEYVRMLGIIPQLLDAVCWLVTVIIYYFIIATHASV